MASDLPIKKVLNQTTFLLLTAILIHTVSIIIRALFGFFWMYRVKIFINLNGKLLCETLPLGTYLKSAIYTAPFFLFKLHCKNLISSKIATVASAEYILHKYGFISEKNCQYLYKNIDQFTISFGWSVFCFSVTFNNRT